MTRLILGAAMVALGCTPQPDDPEATSDRPTSEDPQTTGGVTEPPDEESSSTTTIDETDDGEPPEDLPPEQPPPDGELRAFPGAEGWGTDTPGGRGGAVYIVDTLDWAGPGSFSEALYAPEPRTIVFEVSGVIDVPAAAEPIGPEHSYLTIAGQTSPGGITFRGSDVGGATLFSYQPGAPDDEQFRHMIVRHVRFRGYGNSDNVSLAGVHHVVFDHCDFSGADDETLDITYAHDLTVQWSTLTNSGPGSRYGFLLGYAPTTRATLHHNLSAHHSNRCFAELHWGKGGTPAEGAFIDVRNNVGHNCANESFLHAWMQPGDDARLNLVGNAMVEGADINPGSTAMFGIEMGTQVYQVDNTFPGFPEYPIWSNPVEVDAAFDAPEVTTTSSDIAFEDVLGLAGAWPRDAMNERTVGEVESGTGRLVESLADIADPLIEDGPAAPADTDRDGMPDAWEEERGFNVGVDDSADDPDGDGWTNLELWLADRAAAVLPN